MRKLLAAAVLALYGMTAGAEDGMYISTLNPLYVSTAFHDSGKTLGIFMSCGSPGRPDCISALERLHTLTDYPACRDNFFIAIVDRSRFAARKESATNEPWLLFSIWTNYYGKIDLLPISSEDALALDCNSIVPIMLDEWARYVER